MSDLAGWLRELFAGTKTKQELPLPQQQPPSPPPAATALDQNDFAVALYGQLRLRSGNLFISPFSVRSALGIAYAGASGETRAQLSTALRTSSSNDAIHRAFAEIIQRIRDAATGEYEMRVVNSLWSQEGAALQPEFVELVNRYYGPVFHHADFKCHAEAARAIINRWVEDRTKRRIRDLIPANGIRHDTRLVLVNAVYLKGKWVAPFAEANTRDKPFYLLNGGDVRTPLMHQRDDVRYVQADGYQAIALPYEGNDLSMLVLLPDRKDGLPDLEARLSAGMLRECASQMAFRDVKLFLPRFKITWGTENLTDQLVALGMPLPFNRDEADFSGINGLKPPHRDALSISHVFHQALVEVNEAGTEAAAATAIDMMIFGSSGIREARPIPTFRADHPFLFAICDDRTQALLFLGRLMNPA